MRGKMYARLYCSTYTFMYGGTYIIHVHYVHMCCFIFDLYCSYYDTFSCGVYPVCTSDTQFFGKNSNVHISCKINF